MLQKKQLRANPKDIYVAVKPLFKNLFLPLNPPLGGASGSELPVSPWLLAYTSHFSNVLNLSRVK